MLFRSGVYPVAPFEYYEQNGKIFSENPNCCTPYILIEAPEWFSMDHLNIISCRIVAELGKNYGKDCEVRSLKMEREELIKAAILKLIIDLEQDIEEGYNEAMSESKKDAEKWRELYQKTTGNNAPKNSL